MLNATTLKALAALTALLFAASGLIGDHDVLYIVDDIAWFGFLLCLLSLVVLTLAVLVKSRRASPGAR